MTDPMTTKAVSDTINVLDKIGLLEPLILKLASKPDAAARQLALVFVELRHAYQVLDDALVEFASLSFESDDSRREATRFLKKARGRDLQQQMIEATGSCGKIWYIYDRYLRGWFQRVFQKSEQDELEDLFNELGTADSKWTAMLEVIAATLSKNARRMLAHVDKGQFEGAAELQHSLLDELRDMQDRIGEGILRMQKLQQKFREISGGVSW